MAILQFKGKTFVQNHHLAVKYHQLIPDKSKSCTDKISLNDNLIIHGDNLTALKALLPTYAGKIKCIYIDPPYNTGNEKWIYNDNVNSPMMQEWLGKIVDKEDLTRHDKWLCMMMPRLKLLRELLSDDGAIFISIDDFEVYNLRFLLNDVFGEENFVAEIIIHSNPKGRVLDRHFSKSHEYVIVYAKDILQTDLSIEKTETDINEQYTEEDEGGKFRLLELRNTHREFGKHNRPNLYFPFYVHPENLKASLNALTKSIKIYPDWDDGFKGCWTWSEQKAKENIDFIKAKRIGSKIKIFRKAYAIDNDGGIARKKLKTIWYENIFNTEKGQQEVDELLGKRAFPSPKPLALVKNCIQVASDPNSIILDSFAGSGTTAHAVLDLNKEDGGNRKFILVECEDYADKTTAERVRRVIKGVKTANDENLKKGLGGSFSFFELGDPIEMESILEGKKLPDYLELARYIFYTATGEEFNPDKVKTSKSFIGETKDYEVYLFYEPDIEKLKKLALTLETAKQLGPYKNKKRLVFAPAKYLDLNDAELIERHGLKGIEYCQLPFEIYKLKG